MQWIKTKDELPKHKELCFFISKINRIIKCDFYLDSKDLPRFCNAGDCSYFLADEIEYWCSASLPEEFRKQFDFLASLTE